ncbi:MAG: hypothetical protein IKQ70_13880 [Bacteroidales bacterium]|nr:hypothetical protein [Bacteroidales bacterium]
METIVKQKVNQRQVKRDTVRTTRIEDSIDYSDDSLYDDSNLLSPPLDKEFYSPEEAYELVMKDVKAIYNLKDAV